MILSILFDDNLDYTRNPRVFLSALVVLRPYSSAQVAKLIAAPARYMVAPIVLLNHEPALLALAKPQIILKELYSLVVALSCVRSQHALQTVLDPTDNTASRPLVGDNKPFAVFAGAEAFVFTAADFIVNEDFVVPLPQLEREVLDELRVFVHGLGALLLGALD